MVAKAHGFSGVWHSTYRVPSGPEQNIIVTEHDVVMYSHGDHLIIESLPNAEGSYMMARFTLDGRIATGSYHSQNSPKSAAQRAIYYGAAQLILSPDGNTLSGKGVGFGRDMKVKMSDWELARVSENHDHRAAKKQAKTGASI